MATSIAVPLEVTANIISRNDRTRAIYKWEEENYPRAFSLGQIGIRGATFEGYTNAAPPYYLDFYEKSEDLKFAAAAPYVPPPPEESKPIDSGETLQTVAEYEHYKIIRIGAPIELGTTEQAWLLWFPKHYPEARLIRKEILNNRWEAVINVPVEWVSPIEYILDSFGKLVAVKRIPRNTPTPLEKTNIEGIVNYKVSHPTKHIEGFLDDINYVIKELLKFVDRGGWYKRVIPPNVIMFIYGWDKREYTVGQVLEKLKETSTLQIANSRYWTYPDYINALIELEDLLNVEINKMDAKYGQLLDAERSLPFHIG